MAKKGGWTDITVRIRSHLGEDIGGGTGNCDIIHQYEKRDLQICAFGCSCRRGSGFFDFGCG